MMMDIHILGGGLYSYWPLDPTLPMDKEKDLGIWRMRFSADNEEAARNVSITVVFDYNLTLKTDPPAEDVLSKKKGDKFDLIARFHTANGQSSKDETLYHGKGDDPDDDSGISCKAYLFFDQNEVGSAEGFTSVSGTISLYDGDGNYITDFTIDLG